MYLYYLARNTDVYFAYPLFFLQSFVACLGIRSALCNCSVDTWILSE